MAKSNRGFFIVWGSRKRIASDGSGYIDTVCPNCRKDSTLHGMSVRRWFTLYWIPIFPTGDSVRFTQCALCKFQFLGTLDQMRAALLHPESGNASFAAAIALFNSLRETPDDSAKLEALLRMYLEMGELGEALSAGRQFSAAVESSDGCMALMAIACARMDDREMAQRYAAAALALNPSNADAQLAERELNTAPSLANRPTLPGAST